MSDLLYFNLTMKKRLFFEYTLVRVTRNGKSSSIAKKHAVKIVVIDGAEPLLQTNSLSKHTRMSKFFYLVSVVKYYNCSEKNYINRMCLRQSSLHLERSCNKQARQTEHPSVYNFRLCYRNLGN